MRKSRWLNNWRACSRTLARTEISEIVLAKFEMGARRRPTSLSACMTSHSNRYNRTIRRHDLVFVSPAAWRSLLQRHDYLAGEPLVVEWVDRGWPLVARRTLPGEAD